MANILKRKAVNSALKKISDPGLTMRSTPAGRAVASAIGKVGQGKLIATRSAIGNIFNANPKYSEALWKKSVQFNRLMNQDIPKEKVNDNYDAEFERLYKAVVDTFTEAGREDLAREFQLTVPKYNSVAHPIDFIATLVKGASSKEAKAGQRDQYKMLRIFKPLMKRILNEKGKASPDDIETLTQLFYNEVVAKNGGTYEPMDFESMRPAEMYHVDESVVKSVTVFIKDLADRKESGEVLPKFLDTIASEGIKVKETLKETAKEEVNKEVGAAVVDNSKMLMIGGVVVLLVLGFVLFKK